jgi:transglutaminase-like putative cysteine protease/tetratricopeptide (TPR) repeat protein
LAVVGAGFLSVPAWAGDQVLYAPAPTWVVPADFAAVADGKDELLLIDRQRMLDGGTVTSYEDVALRLTTPDAVSKLNTMTLQWYPDKGDLTVHRLEIVRDGQTIDVLKGGAKFSVLRRETGLERREVNGRLTAVLAVPDLRVGDILRITKSTSVRDQAFKDDVQLVDVLLPNPLKIGLGREIVSWPEGSPMRWKATGKASLAAPVKVGGFERLTVPLPVDKPAEMPDDAPLRYRISPMLQVTSFQSWQDVSRELAPYFDTAGTIKPGGPIAQEIARIEKQAADPLERAALALRTVQDEISYLANGLDGGNYIPQSPAETWTKRYGDCKAKSFLLAAMLREMGIEADLVLVNAESGDAVASLLPQPSDFNHMIVRAKIAGQDYWLDGTSAGARLANIAEVPAFEYALPVRREGADLVTIEQRWQPTPDRVLHIQYDYSAGVDLPALFTVDVDLSGILAARLRDDASEKDPKKQRELVAKYLEDIFDDCQLVDGTVSYDPASGTAKVHGQLYYAGSWDTENGKQYFEPALASTNLEFKPNRSRQAWQGIPYQLGGPERYREEVTFLLPDGGKGFTYSGLKDFSDVVAGHKIERHVTVAGDRISFVDDISTIPVEIAAADFAAERAKAARLKSGDPKIEASPTTPYYWQLDPATFRQRTRRLDAALDTIVAHSPDEPWVYSLRADLRKLGPDKQAALADMNKAIELGATSERYSARSDLRSDLGDLDGALADARQAYDLDPKTDEAIALANAMAAKRDYDGALELLEGLDVSGDDKVSAIVARADIAGQAKYFDDGWALLEDALKDRPGDVNLLNAECWYQGTWKYRLEEAPDTCTKAVQVSNFAPGVLDSRALAYFRLGRTKDALGDLDNALHNAPLQVTSRYLRGIIASEDDPKEGRKDLDDAKRLAPSVDRIFERYGISAPS